MAGPRPLHMPEHTHSIPQPIPKPSRVIFCSYTAACCAICVTYPLDTIKTRLQTYHYPTFGKCIQAVYSEGGIKAFYRGITSSLISASASRAFAMSMYTSMLPTCARLLGTTDERSTGVALLSGFAAGAATTAFTCPFEFTKVASQVEAMVYKDRGLPEPKHAGTWQAVKDIMKRGGVRRLYGGFEYQLARDSIGSAVYFAVYERAKVFMSQLVPSDSKGAPHPIAVSVAGGMCGVMSWIAVYPIDTMKSTYQKDLYNHALSTSMEFRDTVVHRPPFRWNLQMYRGLGFSILRTSLNGVVLFSCYEYLLRLTSQF